jgi:hypothetical protein
MRKTRDPNNLSEMTRQELIDVGAPYLVNPADLTALGIDPELYRKSGRGAIEDENGKLQPSWWAGYMLDRKQDAALIARLETMREQHKTKQ